MKFSVIMSAWEPWRDICKAVGCMLSQSHSDWDLVVVSDGDPDPIISVARNSQKHHSGGSIQVVSCERAAGLWGNRARRLGLDYCVGEYVCWINHDNIVFPDYLSAHARNIEKTPGCLSVVNIEYWTRHKYFGRFPLGTPRLTKIDLLNFAMPLEIARQVDVFGPATERIHHADWLGFEAASRLIPVEQVPQSDTPVGVHF